jgi:heme/copper-type cytochrome/quinol oxidase subunit 4
MAESQSKKKAFTMVGGICSLVAAAMAVVFAIYCLVYMFKDFGNNNPGWAIFELVLAVLIVALAAVAVLGGLKLLAGSNLPASSNDTFRAVFFFFAIVFAAICLTEGLAWTIQGINNQVDVGGMDRSSYRRSNLLSRLRGLNGHQQVEGRFARLHPLLCRDRLLHDWPLVCLCL